MPFGGLLTVGLISAGAGLGSAALASHASGKAADQQTAAADKALEFEKQQYQQQRADVMPFLNRANAAGDTLNGLMGLPGGTPQTDTPGYNWGPPPGAIPDQYGKGFGILQPGVTPEQALDPNFQYGGAQNQSSARFGPAQGGSFSGPNAQAQSSYATMRSPDGKDTQQVPLDQVPHYQQLGAVRIG